MRGRSYIAQGIILKRTNTGESDRILTFYTKDHGKIKVLAKGVRKITSRRGGRLEILSWIKARIARGRSVDIITEVESIKRFVSPGENLEKTGKAYEIIELVDKLTAEGVVNAEVFSLMVDFLEKIGRHQIQDRADVSLFAVELLRFLGFWPKDRDFKGDWRLFVESLIEKPLKSPRVLVRMVKEVPLR